MASIDSDEEDMVRRGSCLTWGTFRSLIGGKEENHENLCQGSRSPSRDLNPEPQEYEAGVFTAAFVILRLEL
jgi:hypothetical protein